jgi:predicted phosphodiesterase
MTKNELGREVLIETLQMLAAAEYNMAAAARMAKIPYITYVKRVDIAKRKFPEGLPEEHKQQARWSIPQMLNFDPNKEITILAGGDLHTWYGHPPIMWEAFCKVAHLIKPDVIVLMGDMIDGARISRYANRYGSTAPKVSVEIETFQGYLQMLPKCKNVFWTLGNHDLRVDQYLAANAPELDDYVGGLADRFPQIKFCMGLTIGETEFRHRFRGGVHTAYNNAKEAGINMITAHTHALQVTATRNRRGTVYGVETGMLGTVNGPQFEYTEGAPTRYQEGFAVLTMDAEGYMFPPELCEKVRGRPVFRGDYVF